MLQEAWSILCESAIFILVGFVIAGVLHVVLSGETLLAPLRRKGARSVIMATLVGMPLPLCSCSVLPTAVTLRKKGASSGATMSFLVSTPETSITSVLLTYGLLGPVLAIFRPLAACLTAIGAGLAANRAERNPPVPEATQGPEVATCDDCHCGAAVGEDDKPAGSASTASLGSRLREGLRYAFVDLFDDIFGWILLGVLAAAAIRIWVPPETLLAILGGPIQSMIIMVLIGVPLYVCAEASTPIAAAFIAQGVSPGAALVFLLVGPATNVGSLGVLHGLLGRRLVVVYLAAIIVVSILMGVILDAVVGFTGISLTTRALEEPMVPGWLKLLGGIAFMILGFFTARRRRYPHRLAEWLSRRTPVRVTPGRVEIALLIALGGGWLASGAFVIRPGEEGVVRRFGAVRRADLGPGLHYALPIPIERVDRIVVGEVRRLVLGVEEGITWDVSWREDARASRYLVGDENIANLQMVVHWGIRDGEGLAYRYGVEDPEELVRNVVLAATREVLAGLPITELFTRGRHAAELEIERVAHERLGRYHSGIRIDSFRLLDAHSPAAVHAAFRDVASAVEDQNTEIDRARSDEARIIPAARARAVEMRTEAESYRSRTLGQARGRADGFAALEAVHGDWPEVTRRRLWFEALEIALPRMQTYLKPPGSSAGGALEIWLVEPDGEVSIPPLDPGGPGR